MPASLALRCTAAVALGRRWQLRRPWQPPPLPPGRAQPAMPPGCHAHPRAALPRHHLGMPKRYNTTPRTMAAAAAAAATERPPKLPAAARWRLGRALSLALARAGHSPRLALGWQEPTDHTTSSSKPQRRQWGSQSKFEIKILCLNRFGATWCLKSTEWQWAPRKSFNVSMYSSSRLSESSSRPLCHPRLGYVKAIQRA